ncbi:Wzz/FepE/Etk N-terminal domain-containing protein [Methyloceanibacter sp.]|uniref:Wzz/FepE/Etk N-terminal domain-containing protein n=1 Tax=Methyloceanibacter sp. TaxID=1965321 RepID=UPI002D53D839|nr:Wzz/FepE/Etk N-terminal domain-containing protein [Methyloceanibacter sp.]HZP08923.1 Wzz/FepE/Etk N-terminal domain-containing protein [Methyloceanibacter sp.]
MTKSHKPAHDDDVDLPTLGRALWNAKGWILGLALGAGAITFAVLSMMRPLYTSEARILIQNDESAFTRPAEDNNRTPLQQTLDEQAVQSQVQVLTSRDLALDVIKALDLPNDPQFVKDEGLSLFRRLLNKIGLRPSPKSEEEKAANTFAENLEVFQLSKSSVIAVEYTSGDSPLAAKIANDLADKYIEWQRKEKLEQTKDATAWLSSQIEVLRKKVEESEAAVEQLRSSAGLYAGSNNVTLNAQQLSEVNSQLILAKAQRSEAEARARLIQQMIDSGGDIDATPEVLKSELIGRLIEQRVQVQRELAQLSATLMPSHPRIKQLNSELADVRAQIRDEAKKIVEGLKNEAEVASARETSLRNSLNDTKAQASGQSDAEIKLRALEREAKANRDLLESYLARYRDASARHDMGAVPAQAAIVSRAHASILPSFPKRGPLSLLVMAATALLALSYVVARELIGATGEGRGRLPSYEPEYEPEAPSRRRPARSPIAPAAKPKLEPAAANPARTPVVIAPGRSELVAQAKQEAAASSAASSAAAPAKPAADPKLARGQHPVPAAKPETVIALGPPETPKAKPAEAPLPPVAEEAPKPKPAYEPAPAKFAQSPKPEAPGAPVVTGPKAKPAVAEEIESAIAASAVAATAASTAESPMRAAQAPKPAAAMASPGGNKQNMKPTAPNATSASTGAAPAESGLLDRLRQNLASANPEPKTEAAEAAPGLLARLRRILPRIEAGKDDIAAATAVTAGKSAEPIPPLKPNDLRHYLNQRIAAATHKRFEEPAEKVVLTPPKVGNGKIGPALKSLDGVMNHILAASKGGAPRAILVSGVTSQVDATQEAIKIARDFVARREQVVLVDLTRGASAVSGPLGLPRAPGFTDLSAGRASFDEVIRVDAETPLQVITAGNPAAKGSAPEIDRFMRVFEALTEAYDCVVLHADPDSVRKLSPALKFELPITLVVLPRGATVESEDSGLRDFASLGCQVVVYEKAGKDGRTGLLGRVAAF